MINGDGTSKEIGRLMRETERERQRERERDRDRDRDREIETGILYLERALNEMSKAADKIS